MLLSEFILGILGLAVGSFIGALTYRLPRRKDIFLGRSFCPKCKKKIFWYDNIPILSYFLLGRKCRNCKEKISWRYPAIELATGIGFVIIGSNLVYLLLFILTFTIFVIDLEHQIIPDSITFIIFIIVITVILGHNFYQNLASGFLAASFFLAINLITRGRGMGLGDAKLAIPLGTFLGFPEVTYWLLGSFIIGAFVGLVLVFLGRAKFGKPIPFGPFLIVSFWISVLL